MMQLKDMSLKHKLGQLMATGFPAETMSEEFTELVRRFKVGNAVLFKYNQMEQGRLETLCQELTEFIRAETGYAPLIASDEEGGVVSRLPAEMAQMPSALAQASLRDAERIENAAQLTGRQLRAVGINFNLAPVLDVNNNADNPVIGVRSYGVSAQDAATYALAALKGYEAAGVMTSGKHFPGHGDTDTDSHLALPTIHKSLAELERLELEPFRAAIAEGIPAVTIAHILFPALEPGGVPATMSRNIITGLLREKMGFDGLVISDCMEMQAIRKTVGIPKAVVEAVKAGMDLIFVSHTPAEVAGAMQALEKAVLCGEIPMRRIDDAVGRVLRFKRRYCLPQLPLPPEELQAARDFAGRFYRDAILASASDGGAPFALGERPLFVSPPQTRATLAANAQDKGYSFADAMRRRFGGTAIVTEIDPAPEEIASALAAAPGHTSVVMGTLNGNAHPAQMRLLEALQKSGLPTACVMLRNPFERPLFPEGLFSAALYEYAPKTVEIATELFVGGATR